MIDVEKHRGARVSVENAPYRDKVARGAAHHAIETIIILIPGSDVHATIFDIFVALQILARVPVKLVRHDVDAKEMARRVETIHPQRVIALTYVQDTRPACEIRLANLAG